tara:strand:- start:3894 stop:4400 length:507 start_codon:yes stop_codon:yes gene_type:complete
MRFTNFALVLLLLLAPASVALAQDAGPAPAPAAATAEKADVPAAPDTKTATPATVPDAPETVEDAAESLDFLVSAAKGGHWSLFLGVLLTLLVWFLTKFVKLKERVGSKALPWVAASLGIVATVGISLSSGLPLVEGLVQGLMTGATSVGLWELVFKHALKPEAKAIT